MTAHVSSYFGTTKSGKTSKLLALQESCEFYIVVAPSKSRFYKTKKLWARNKERQVDIDAFIHEDRELSPVEICGDSTWTSVEEFVGERFDLKTKTTTWKYLHIFVDECQFIPVHILKQFIAAAAQHKSIKLHFFGLRTDYKQEVFPSSLYLFSVSRRIFICDSAACKKCKKHTAIFDKMADNNFVEDPISASYDGICFSCAE